MNGLLIQLTRFFVSFKDTNQSPIEYFNSMLPNKEFVFMTYLAIALTASIFIGLIVHPEDMPRRWRVILPLTLFVSLSYFVIDASVDYTLFNNRIHSTDIPEKPRDYNGTKMAILDDIHHDELSNYHALITEDIITELPKDNETIGVESLEQESNNPSITLVLNNAKKEIQLEEFYDIKFINPDGYTDENIQVLKESKPELIKMNLAHYKRVEFDITFSYDKNGKTLTETISLAEFSELKIFNQEEVYLIDSTQFLVNPLKTTADIIDIQLVITDEEQAQQILNDRKALE